MKVVCFVGKLDLSLVDNIDDNTAVVKVIENEFAQEIEDIVDNNQGSEIDYFTWGYDGDDVLHNKMTVQVHLKPHINPNLSYKSKDQHPGCTRGVAHIFPLILNKKYFYN